MSWTTKQSHLLAAAHSRRRSQFGHIVWIPYEADAKKIFTAAPLLDDWSWPPGRRRITWLTWNRRTSARMKKQSDVAQNRPLCRDLCLRLALRTLSNGSVTTTTTKPGVGRNEKFARMAKIVRGRFRPAWSAAPHFLRHRVEGVSRWISNSLTRH